LSAAFAGANGATLNLNAAGTGTVTITDAHTAGTTTIATNGGVRTINATISSATGPFTVTGATATTITATAGVHAITGGAGADTITGFTGADTIVGGGGGDRITTGGGADRINMAAADTGLVTGLAASGAIWANGTILGTSALDVITGFVPTAAIVLTDITTLSTTTIVRNGGTLGAADAGNVAHITGTYDSSANTFTTSLAGTSTLFVYDDNGTTALGNYRAVVLVGYVDGAGNDTAGTSTGLFGVA